ncbi:Proline--tRNA ligase [Eumeta japonica]|uniref:Proline--tRNA ligase n=1 Tax=Eumeta variegata TaxID=151549 RepID=A0A4C1T7N9_EUMVA|nr:Proline--tRNA ligase [Eumeta japonica]
MLPLGKRVLDKIEGLISTILESVGAQRISLPALTSSSLWECTGRLETCATELMIVTDRHKKDYVLSPTHEEAVADLLADVGPLSYKQLPLILYQDGIDHASFRKFSLSSFLEQFCQNRHRECRDGRGTLRSVPIMPEFIMCSALGLRKVSLLRIHLVTYLQTTLDIVSDEKVADGIIKLVSDFPHVPLTSKQTRQTKANYRVNDTQQISNKYRDEFRPKHGLLRSREFLMMDAYSLHTDNRCAEQTYCKMSDAYQKLFDRLEMPVHRVVAPSGDMGGTTSHEWHVTADAGEDSLATCGACGAAALAHANGPICTRCRSKSDIVNSIEREGPIRGLELRRSLRYGRESVSRAHVVLMRHMVAGTLSGRTCGPDALDNLNSHKCDRYREHLQQ